MSYIPTDPTKHLPLTKKISLALKYNYFFELLPTAVAPMLCCVAVLVADYLVCVTGGTSCANLDQVLAIISMLPKLG